MVLLVTLTDKLKHQIRFASVLGNERHMGNYAPILSR